MFVSLLFRVVVVVFIVFIVFAAAVFTKLSILQIIIILCIFMLHLSFVQRGVFCFFVHCYCFIYILCSTAKPAILYSFSL